MGPHQQVGEVEGEGGLVPVLRLHHVPNLVVDADREPTLKINQPIIFKYNQNKNITENLTPYKKRPQDIADMLSVLKEKHIR